MASAVKKFLVDIDLNGNVIKEFRVESLSDIDVKDLDAASNAGRVYWNSTKERLMQVVGDGNKGYQWSTVANGKEIEALQNAIKSITLTQGKGITLSPSSTGTAISVSVATGTNALRSQDDGSLYVPDVVGTTNEVDVNLSEDGKTKTIGLDNVYKKSVTDGITNAESNAKQYTDAVSINSKTKEADSQNIVVRGSDTELAVAYTPYALKDGEQEAPAIKPSDKVSDAISILENRANVTKSDIQNIRSKEIKNQINDSFKDLKTVGDPTGTVVTKVSQSNGLVTVEYNDLNASQIKAGANNASTVAKELLRFEGKLPEVVAGENIVITPKVDETTGKTTYTIATDVKVFEFQGQVKTVKDLDTIENPEQGNTYFVVEKGILYAYDGAEWVAMGHPTDKVTEVDVTPSHGVALTNPNGTQVGVTVTPGTVAEGDESVVTGGAVSDAITKATAIGVVAHSYMTSLAVTAGTALTIDAATHKCGNFPIVQICDGDGNVVDVQINISKEGTVTILSNASFQASIHMVG